MGELTFFVTRLASFRSIAYITYRLRFGAMYRMCLLLLQNIRETMRPSNANEKQGFQALAGMLFVAI